MLVLIWSLEVSLDIASVSASYFHVNIPTDTAYSVHPCVNICKFPFKCFNAFSCIKNKIFPWYFIQTSLDIIPINSFSFATIKFRVIYSYFVTFQQVRCSTNIHQPNYRHILRVIIPYLLFLLQPYPFLYHNYSWDSKEKFLG